MHVASIFATQRSCHEFTDASPISFGVVKMFYF